MKRIVTRRNAVVAAVVAGLAVAGGGAAIAVGGDDDGRERPITGPALTTASEAALAHTGGGRVTGTEVGDEESMYEVEVALEGGGRVDVQLDADFRVVGSEADAPGGEEEGAP